MTVTACKRCQHSGCARRVLTLWRVVIDPVDERLQWVVAELSHDLMLLRHVAVAFDTHERQRPEHDDVLP